MSQHASLTPERWSRYAVDQQILMIANEMHRTMKRLADPSPEPRRLGYERILRLTDLTVQTDIRPTLRRELLRWRDLIAECYIADAADVAANRAAFRLLLQINPVTARQIPLLLD
jgi:hypothetical protein